MLIWTSYTLSRLAHAVCGKHLSEETAPRIRRGIQLASTLGFIHAHFSHRDGAASASSAHCSQLGARTLPRITHGCGFMPNIFHLPLDNCAGFVFEDEDLFAERRWVIEERRGGGLCVAAARSWCRGGAPRPCASQPGWEGKTEHGCESA